MTWASALAALAAFLKALWEKRGEIAALLVGYGAAKTSNRISALETAKQQSMDAAHEAQKDMARDDRTLVDGLLDNADRQRKYRQSHKL